MADNSLQGGADTIRDIDRAGVKTQVTQLDVGGAASESLLVRGQQAMASSLPVALASNQSAIPINIPGTVSTVNTSTAALGISGVFTGTSEDISGFATISVSVFADVASATDGLQMQQSSNGTNWDNIDFYTVPASTGKTFKADVSAKFFRIVYTNGGTAQTAFRLQTMFSQVGHMGSSIRPQDARSLQNDMREVVAYSGLFNGSTLDLARGTIANGALVDVSRLPALVAGTAVVGKTGIDQTTPGTTNLVALTAETTKVIGTVNPPAITKGTQSANGFTTQDMKDAGRTALSFYAVAAAAGATGVETAITLTKSSGTAATSTAVSFVVTSGKRFRITHVSVATRGNATATIQTTTFNLRINTAGAVVTTTTPIVFAGRSATPATASAWDRYTIPVPDGYEIVGDGTLQFGITANSTFVTNAPTWDVNIIGFEY